jgi:hypothetical protein
MFTWGKAAMKKSIAAAALMAAAIVPVSAADSSCFSAADTEAVHAIVLQSTLTVLSSSCNEDVMYGEFKVRNQAALVGYQHQLIAHLGERGFETWFTHVTNEASIQHAGLPSAAICLQTVAQLKYDPAAMHNYLVAHATDPIDGPCAAPRVRVAHHHTTVTHE